MDQPQLVELAKQALIYMSPLIAQGALKKIGERTTDATITLVHKTWDFFERIFRGNDEAEAALTLYKVKPEDKGRQEIMEGEIVARLGERPTAASELAAFVQQAHELDLVPQQIAQRIHNQSIRDNAQIGAAVAGDVYGGVSVDTNKGKQREPNQQENK
jgi:hypothetical protein